MSEKLDQFRTEDAPEYLFRGIYDVDVEGILECLRDRNTVPYLVANSVRRRIAGLDTKNAWQIIHGEMNNTLSSIKDPREYAIKVADETRMHIGNTKRADADGMLFSDHVGGFMQSINYVLTWANDMFKGFYGEDKRDVSRKIGAAFKIRNEWRLSFSNRLGEFVIPVYVPNSFIEDVLLSYDFRMEGLMMLATHVF